MENQAETTTLRPKLALLAVIIGLATPVIQQALGPFMENNIPYPMSRFVSLWIFWITVGIALFVSVKLEGLSLSTFGIGKNKRSLRYRLIELNGALIIGLILSVVLYLFSTFVRDLLNSPQSAIFNPENILPFWVMFPAWITASFCEEFLFRSYPIERLTLMTGNIWFGAGISLLAFVSLHLFNWDWIHVLTFILPGSILITGLYIWRRSLWFVVVIHAVLNLPLLFLPLLKPYL